MKTKEILKACLAVLGLLAAVYMALNPDVLGIAGMSLAFAGVVGPPVMEMVRGRNVSIANEHILRPETTKHDIAVAGIPRTQQILLFVNVHLSNYQLSIILLSQLIQYRSNPAAVSAPRRPEIDQR